MVKPTAKIVRKGEASKVIQKIQGSLDGPKGVKVGFPAGEVDRDIVLRASVNEFGATIPVTAKMRGWFWAQGANVSKSTITIPERPFMRTTFKENREDYQQFLRQLARQVLGGQANIAEALNTLGVKAVGDIQDTIGSLSEPPNAPFTIKQKRSSNPLIETGEMRQSVTHKLEDEV